MNQPQTDDLLDIEFKKMLCLLRQHIPFVSSNAYLEQCKFWLEKLSNSNINKEFRNSYLTELCKQIQTNQILPLFDEAMPSGDQIKLATPLFDNETFKEFAYICTLGNTCSRSISSQNSSVTNKQEEQETVKEVKSNIENKNYQKTSKKINRNLISNNIKEKATNQSETKISILKEVAADDNDSWSDLTSDVDSDAEFNHTKNEGDIQRRRGEKSAQGPNPTAKEHQLNNIGYKLYFSKLEKTIATLQIRLSEMFHQNRELRDHIQALQTQKQENIIENKTQNMKFHREEIDKLNEFRARHALEEKNNFQKCVEKFNKELEEKVNLVSCNYEQKISEIKNENDRMIKDRDNEINRLSEIIQNQCLRIMNDLSIMRNQVSNCTCNKKVHILKKCVSKMDRIFQKSEKDYIKQIEILRQELDQKENALQMQMKVQNAQVVAQIRTDQKEEFEEILNSLEVKYIKMLEGHEQQISRLKKQDEQKIQRLIELLERHGIPYNNM